MISESEVWSLKHVWEYHSLKSHLSWLHNPSIPGLKPGPGSHKSQHPTVILYTHHKQHTVTGLVPWEQSEHLVWHHPSVTQTRHVHTHIYVLCYVYVYISSLAKSLCIWAQTRICT